MTGRSGVERSRQACGLTRGLFNIIFKDMLIATPQSSSTGSVHQEEVSGTLGGRYDIELST